MRRLSIAPACRLRAVLAFLLFVAASSGAATLAGAGPADGVPNVPPTVTVTNPLDNAEVQVPPNVLLGATAADSDGFVTKVEFFINFAKVGEATNSPFTVSWAPSAGGIYALEAQATDNLGATTISPEVLFTVTTTNGLLTASVTNPPASVNLATEGVADWVHWGLITESSFNRKSGIIPLLSNYTLVGFGPVYSYNDNPTGYTWTNGTPTASATDTTTGIYVVGTNNGFEVVAPADTATRTLKLYAGAYGARGKLRAHLSDYSTPIYTDTSIDYVGNGPGGVYTFIYAAATNGQTLRVRYTVDTNYDFFGNVTIQAATLTGGNLPPTTSITSPADNTSVLAPGSILIQANASDPDGTVAKVEFFQGATKLGEVTNSPYVFSWNSVPAGYYTLTTKATDNVGATFVSSPVNVFVGIGGGVLGGSQAAAPASVDLTSEGVLDWGHWGLINRDSFNHRSGAAEISTYTALGTNLVQRLTDSATSFLWNNGSPTAGPTNTTTGVYINGLTNGFRITVPADTTLRRLRVFAGVYAARGRFRATLNDFSAPPLLDTSLANFFGTSLSVYTIRFAAASAGQTLTVDYTADALFDADFGNVTLEAASLSQPVFGPFAVHSMAGTSSLSFPTDALSTYLVEFTDSLTPSNWQALTNIPGTGSLTNVIDPGSPGLDKRFYRIRLD